MPTVIKKLDAARYQLKDQVVAINRVTKVVKGGKNLSFAALVVVGDPSAAVVGYGSGKAKEVPQAIRKGIESAKKNLIRVNLTQTSIPHLVLGRYGAGKVLLKPAPEGTGVIAGGAVRAVMTSVGIQNVLTKSIGTTNPHNVIKATFDALKQLKSRELVAAMRGRSAQELWRVVGNEYRKKSDFRVWQRARGLRDDVEKKQ
jgi:small subunit ribosomal protein S5